MDYDRILRLEKNIMFLRRDRDKIAKLPELLPEEKSTSLSDEITKIENYLEVFWMKEFLRAGEF